MWNNDQIEILLERIARTLEIGVSLLARQLKIESIQMSQTQDLIDAATAETNAEQALMIVFDGWIAAFQKAHDSGNQAQVQTVIDQMKKNTVAMVNAITANTVPTDDTDPTGTDPTTGNDVSNGPITTDPRDGQAVAPSGTIPPNAQGTGAGQQNGPPTDASTGLSQTATDAGTPPSSRPFGSPV